MKRGEELAGREALSKGMAGANYCFRGHGGIETINKINANHADARRKKREERKPTPPTICPRVRKASTVSGPALEEPKRRRRATKSKYLD